ncbi:hypothetical protein BDK51DRAFT_49496 [Blyttiomyces helicus]|uniref:Uncharacterized protein n=1 Tax=Blyttiomyces helicus TaxID=388810 RepID=A0A4P9VWC1_9FUNG|nr:hypothetical protein BDK51DRAFT_49496 [Blyttiomyces helicus]|eukprot:RKO83999.1 hypothetical protein BDK51DRAFT_49496 [Blyttiomyces helicus]
MNRKRGPLASDSPPLDRFHLKRAVGEVEGEKEADAGAAEGEGCRIAAVLVGVGPSGCRTNCLDLSIFVLSTRKDLGRLTSGIERLDNAKVMFCNFCCRPCPLTLITYLILPKLEKIEKTHGREQRLLSCHSQSPLNRPNVPPSLGLLKFITSSPAIKCTGLPLPAMGDRQDAARMRVFVLIMHDISSSFEIGMFLLLGRAFRQRPELSQVEVERRRTCEPKPITSQISAFLFELRPQPPGNKPTHATTLEYIFGGDANYAVLGEFASLGTQVPLALGHPAGRVGDVHLAEPRDCLALWIASQVGSLSWIAGPTLNPATPSSPATTNSSLPAVNTDAPSSASSGYLGGLDCW